MLNLILVFVLGSVVGSFLNVCIYRIPQKQSIVFPPSHCPDCNTKLKPADLIPVLSYLFYKGKCRYCGETISIQYPFIELLTGIVYLLLFIKFGYSIDFIFFVVLCTLLIIISGIDYEHKIIPDGIVLGILVIAIIYKSITYFYLRLSVDWIGSLIGLLIGGGFLLLVALVSKGGMGGGDIKLMGVLGFWLGWKLTIVTMLVSFITGAFLSALLLLFKIKDRKDAIPFGPFIALAAFITILKGNELLHWYLKNIL